MSEKFKARNREGLYFITTTIVDWVDLFTRPTYKHIIVDSLNYCVAHKGLKIHAWVLMSNHIHLIVSCENDLASVMRDFKSFTSKQFSKAIDAAEESRKDWLLGKFRYAANRVLRGKDFKIWKDGYHPVELIGNEMIDQKMDYIHDNPVRQEIVFLPEHYLYSSARDYCGEKGLVKIESI
jgi:putative transposase